MNRVNVRFYALLGMLIACLLAFFVQTADAAEPEIRIPDASAMYRRAVEQAAAELWGVEASPARLAALIHRESHWRERARSRVGAQGMAQFMPATAKWLASKFPDQLGAFDPWDAGQAIQAAALYLDWLADRNPGATPCDTWAFAHCAYNGGESWLRRDQRLTYAAGADPAVWFDSVEMHTSRAAWARKENRAYVRSILLTLEPAYIAAGWSGQAVCP